MHSAALLAALALLSSVVLAIDVTVHTPMQPITVGQSTEFTWETSPNDNKDIPGIAPGTKGDLWLARGPSANLTPVTMIASGLDPNTGKVAWVVPNTVTNGNDYALEWRWEGQPPNTPYKYSSTITFVGGANPPTTSQAATSSASATAAATKTTTASATATAATTSSPAPTRVALGPASGAAANSAPLVAAAALVAGVMML
ncbi:hypothetical protein RI367_003823 [Sorochytrium milnesiophthora]